MKLHEYIDLLSKTAEIKKLIELRIKFRSEYPEDFKNYMELLKDKGSSAWYGCLDCKFYQSRCTINMKPQSLRSTSDRLEYYCSSYQKK